MELLRYTILKDCFINEIPILKDADKNLSKITPSHFMEEMSLTTEERLNKIITSFYKKKSQSKDGLIIIPDIVVFQNFEIGAKYTIPLTIKNVNKISCPLRLFYEKSPYFSVTYACNSIPTKLAPGMELKFSVEFNAEALKDYSYRIIFLISDKEYLIPVIAIGPRPLLDFPDNITLPTSVVKTETKTHVLVKNKGQIPAIFDIHIEEPFSIDPNKGILDANEAAQFVIKFKSNKEGYFKNQIIIHYETGEKLMINLQAMAKYANIFLLDNVTSFKDTYVGLLSTQIIKIRNESDHIAKFVWKQFNSSELDEIALGEYAEFKDNSRREQAKFKMETGELNEFIYDRIYKDELNQLHTEEHFLFAHPDFIITPPSGEVWPNTTLESTVIFSPKKVEEFSCIAYCEVTGRNDRLPLKLHGRGIGPKFEFDRDMIDLDEIVLYKSYNFDIVVHNEGPITAHLTFMNKDYEFRSQISCEQKSLCLKSTETGTFHFEFCPTTEGYFLEEIHLLVEFSNEIRKVFIKGQVLYPIIIADASELYFGEVQAGEKITKNITIHNLYNIAIPFDIKIIPNGTNPAVSFEECQKLGRFTIPDNPQEYICIPSKGVMAENSSMVLKLTLIPNVSRSHWSTELFIECWNCTSKQIVIQLLHSVRVPKLVWEPNKYNISSCINYESFEHITISNKSAYSAYIDLFTEVKDSSPFSLSHSFTNIAAEESSIVDVTAYLNDFVQYEDEIIIKNSEDLILKTEITEAVMKPLGKIDVKFYYICSKIGQQCANIMMKLFGEQPKNICEVVCTGIGPKITVTPEILNFGKINVIECSTKSFSIKNESPIPADIAFQVKDSSPFSLSHSFTNIAAEESSIVDVTAYLNDFVQYEDEIIIKVKNSHPTKYKMKAKGIGTAITITPNVKPNLDFGSKFTRQLMKEVLLFENKGIRIHKILISPIQNLKKMNEKDYVDKEYAGKIKFAPYYFVLKESEKIEVEVTSYKNKPGVITEDFYIYAKIEGEEKKELLFESSVHVNFVEPKLTFSKHEMNFRIDIDYNSTVAVVEDMIKVTNETPLALEIDTRTEKPFYIIEEDGYLNDFYLKLEPEDSHVFKIFFDKSTFGKKSFVVHNSLKFKYRRQPKKDSIKLYAEVNYPTIDLAPKLIDFGCIPCDSYTAVNVELKNISPLPVKYNFVWDEDGFSKYDIIPSKKSEPSQILETFIRKDFLALSTPTESTIEEMIEIPLEEPALEGKQLTSKKSKKNVTTDKKDKKDKKSKKNKEGTETTSKTTTATKTDKKKPASKAKKQEPEIKPLPIEYVFEHYYIETTPQVGQIQIYQELHGPISKKSLIRITERNIENSTKMKQLLFSSVYSHTEDDSLYTTFRNLPETCEEVNEIDSFLELVPFHGYLDPYESQIVSILFRPKCNTLIKAKVMCEVLKGVTQLLEITGMSSDVTYELEEELVDFDRQLYYKPCQRTLTLTNRGFVSFSFAITSELGRQESPCSGWFYTEPQAGVVEPNSEVTFTVSYQPGIDAKLMQNFMLEIGNLSPISLQFKGYGVIPQIYLNMPKVAVFDEATVLGYLAISKITSDFAAVVDLELTDEQKNEEYEYDIPKEERKTLKRDGWVILSQKNKYPTKIDIDLAVERKQFRDYVISNPSLSIDDSILNKAKQFIGFMTTPYLLDFSYVITDTMAHYTVQIFNYGPSDVKIRIVQTLQKSGFFEAGFNVQTTNNVIRAGETAPLHVIFNPTYENYPLRRHDVEQKLFLEVFYGVRIPINIQAVVTVPYLTLSTEFINFEKVICGRCKVKNLILKNTGYVPCEWEAEINKRQKKENTARPMFYIKMRSGLLNPNEYISLDVYFEPCINDQMHNQLMIYMKENRQKLITHLSGEGVEPSLKIEKTFFKFKPCIPEAQESIEYMTIENCCDFPIEFYFADFDQQILDEDKILRVLGQYYSSDTFYIPPRLAGEKFPQPLLDFYNELLLELQYKCSDKDINESVSYIGSITKGKKVKKKRTSSVGSKESTHTQTTEPLPDKIAKDTTALLRELIDAKLQAYSENLDQVSAKLELKDPVKMAITNAKPLPLPSNPNAQKEGILFIFFGAPYTDYIYEANKTAKNLNLPVTNITQLICESLVYNSSTESIKLNELINNAYNEAMDINVAEQNVVSDEPEKPRTDIELLEELHKKIETLRNPPVAVGSKKSTPKSSARASKSTMKSNASTGSKKSKEKPLLQNTETLIGIPQELLVEILRQQIREYKLGLIIETLDNSFILKPILTLMNVLKAIGNITYIHFILINNTVAKEIELLTKNKQIQMKQMEDSVNNMLEHFDEISEEELETLTEEQKDLYKNVYLAKRKEYTQKRMEILREKKEVKITAKSKLVDKKKKKADIQPKLPDTKLKEGKSLKKVEIESSVHLKKGKKGLSQEEQKLENEFNEFDKTFQEILHILQYWDRKSSTLTKEYNPVVMSSRDAKKKAKSPEKKITNPQSEKLLEINPVHVWIMNEMSREKSDKIIISSIIKNFIDFQDATSSLYESLIEKIETIDELFSVLRVPSTEREQNISDIFAISNYDGTTLVQNSINNISTERVSLKPKRTSKRKKSSKKSSKLLSKIFTVPVGNLQKRSVILPGETMHYYLQFLPKEIGFYEHVFKIQIVGWNAIYLLQCKGTCDVPKIDMDPYVLFPKVVPEKTEWNEYQHCMFIQNTETFDFGNSLVCEVNATNNRKYPTETAFNLRNISWVPCEIRAYLEEETNNFKLDQDTLTLLPGQIECLIIDACPTVLGSNTNSLLLAIKDNPQVEKIKLECTGCRLDFQISNSKLNFERVLLNHCERRKLLLLNNSAVSVNFKFANISSLPKNFNISPPYGYIKKDKSAEVMFEYCSSRVEEIPKLKIQLQVYDEFYRGEPIYTEFIELSAETRDVEIDCEENINLGEVKVRKPYNHAYNFLNRGKYNVIFEISEIADPELKKSEIAILSMFKINNKSGTLQPNKILSTTISFNASKTIDITNFPVYKCDFLDHINQQLLTTFFITATVKSHYSQYEVSPKSNINFGALLIGSTTSQVLVIKNTGRFDFDYNIVCKRLNLASTTKMKGVKLKVGKKGNKPITNRTQSSLDTKKGSKKSEESKKSAKSGKESGDSAKSKKSKGSKKSEKESKVVVSPPIHCSAFTIKNATGKIKPNEKSEIEIECNLYNLGSLEDIVTITISESAPKDLLGHEIKLTAKGCLPTINFEDYGTIFQECYIVESQSDFVKPKEIDQHCVFAKETKCIAFNNVCINTTASVQIQFFNNSMIEAELILRPPADPAAFRIEPLKLLIMPYAHANFVIYFSPTCIQLYEDNFEVQLQMPQGYKTETVTFLLCGDGKIPEISLIKPKFTDNGGKYMLKFKPTLVEQFSSKSLVFENIGDFPCKVIIEICNDNEDVFSLEVNDNTVELLNCSKYSDVQRMQHSNMVRLIPGQIANFNLKYFPKKIDVNKCSLKLHIVNNPFENFVIDLHAESYSEDIILEGIDTLINSSSYSNIDMESYRTSYKLDFGNTFLKTLQKTRFKIVNRTKTDIYKFDFRSVDEVVFIPCTGHLKPLSSKEIIVTFLSDVPIVYDKIALECVICKIEYVSPNLVDISWDERQTLVVYENLNNLDNISGSVNASICRTTDVLLDECKEPEINVIKNSRRRISVLLHVVSGYSLYRCPIKIINFAETLMFEKRVYTFDIHNPGEITLEIIWDILLDNCNTNRVKSATIKETDDFNINAKPGPGGENILNIEAKTKRPRPLTGKERFIGDQCKSRESLPSSSKITVSSIDNYMPFTITPEHVNILPKRNTKITVIFAPLDIYEYKAHLKGKVFNLSPEFKNINIEIFAKSIMPCCYFDVQMSDYITNGRRQIKGCDDYLDLNTKVVEANFLGTGIKHNIKFNIVNPTEEELEYSWHKIKSDEFSSVSLFDCELSKGSIKAGKQSEASFSFLPQSTGTFESLYNFNVETYNLGSTFLFVANVHEADVYFLKPKLNLKPTVMGINIFDYVTLRNNEDIDINYKFRKASLYSEGRKQFVTIEPKKGLMPRNSDTRIKINYNPLAFGDVIFNLKCDVDFHQEPINLSVTGICYEVQASLAYSILNEGRITLNSEIDNVIDIGDMSLHHLETVTFFIKNLGRTGLYYQWNYNDEIIERQFNLNITDKEGYIKIEKEMTSTLNIIALKSAALKNYKMELQVKYGPSYRILLNGTAMNVFYKFSFLQYDFGPSFIQTSNICYYRKTLEFLNYGLKPLTLECQFINTEYLTINFKIKQIPPKSKELIEICFYPRKCQRYSEDVTFVINTQTVKLNINGEGVNVNIQVVNIQDKCIDFGTPKAGKIVKRTVKVINKSPALTEAAFNIWDNLPFYTNPLPMETHHLDIPKKERIIEEYASLLSPTTTSSKKMKKEKKIPSARSSKSIKSDKKGKTDKKASSKISDDTPKSKLSKKEKDSQKSLKTKIYSYEDQVEKENIEELERNLRKSMFTFSPKTTIKILPNKSAEFDITFSPTKRVPNFTEKVSVQVLETVQPLCVLKACCFGVDFHLDKDIIPFGTVVLNCSRENKFVLINDGDIGSSFKWQLDNCDEFSIQPMQGYSSPGSLLTFNVTYQPVCLNKQSKRIMECHINVNEKPLYIELTGNCSNIPPATATVTFKCPVRTEDKKSVTISNSSGEDWTVFSSITGEYFSCENIIQIAAKTTAQCDIFYRPFVMTRKLPHIGFILFKLPTGKAIVYNFEGVALPPGPIESRLLEFPCKTKRTELLLIKNWSRLAQHFKIFTENITPDSALHLYKLTGNEFIDMLGNEETEYKWSIYVYKECLLEFRVIFMNDEKEYMFYHIYIKVGKSKPQESITLATCVRTPVSRQITLINPLDLPILYKLTCIPPVLSFKSAVTVEPHSEVKEFVEYQPLIAEKTMAILEAYNQDLGTYSYEFLLNADPPVPETALKFATILGEPITLNAVVTNLTQETTSFTCQINGSPPFYVDKIVSLLPNQNLNIPVLFDPHETGKVDATLMFNSPTAGDFIYPLEGTCLPPKPKGPFLLRPGQTITISFYNPFLKDDYFILKVEPDMFVVNSKEEFIKSKTSKNIIIKMLDKINLKYPNVGISGKVTIIPKEKSLNQFKWSFYIQGSVDV